MVELLQDCYWIMGKCYKIQDKTVFSKISTLSSKYTFFYDKGDVKLLLCCSYRYGRVLSLFEYTALVL